MSSGSFWDEYESRLNKKAEPGLSMPTGEDPWDEYAERLGVLPKEDAERKKRRLASAKAKPGGRVPPGYKVPAPAPTPSPDQVSPQAAQAYGQQKAQEQIDRSAGADPMTKLIYQLTGGETPKGLELAQSGALPTARPPRRPEGMEGALPTSAFPQIDFGAGALPGKALGMLEQAGANAVGLMVGLVSRVMPYGPVGSMAMDVGAQAGMVEEHGRKLAQRWQDDMDQMGFAAKFTSDPVTAIAEAGIENAGPLLTIMGLAAAGGAPAAMSGAFFMEGGEAYANALREGRSNQEATNAGILAGTLNTALETFPALRAVKLPKKVKEKMLGPVSRLAEVAFQTAAEAGTEGVQEFNIELASYLAWGKENGMKAEELWSPEAAEQYFAAMAAGGGMGLVSALPGVFQRGAQGPPPGAKAPGPAPPSEVPGELRPLVEEVPDVGQTVRDIQGALDRIVSGDAQGIQEAHDAIDELARGMREEPAPERAGPSPWEPRTGREMREPTQMPRQEIPEAEGASPFDVLTPEQATEYPELEPELAAEQADAFEALKAENRPTDAVEVAPLPPLEASVSRDILEATGYAVTGSTPIRLKKGPRSLPQDGLPPLKKVDYTLRPIDVAKPETISSRRWYHGTGHRILRKLSDFDYASANPFALFGPGLYLTDDPNTAAGYAGRRHKSGDGHVLEGRLPKDISLIDLEQLLPDDAREVMKAKAMEFLGLIHRDGTVPSEDALRKIPSYNDMMTAFEAPQDAEGDAGPRPNGVGTWRTLMGVMGVYEGQDRDALGEWVADELLPALARLGYDGFSHLGGVVSSGEPKHNVVILWGKPTVVSRDFGYQGRSIIEDPRTLGRFDPTTGLREGELPEPTPQAPDRPLLTDTSPALPPSPEERGPAPEPEPEPERDEFDWRVAPDEQRREAVEDRMEEEAPPEPVLAVHGKPEDGAWIGTGNEAVDAEGNYWEFSWGVVDADDLVPSHNARGDETPNHPDPELQRRHRDKPASVTQMQSIGNQPRPGELMDGVRVGLGAPFVRPDGVVMDGNGRTAGLQLAYQQGNADDYRDAVLEEAERQGLDTDLLGAIEKPVLVRFGDYPKADQLDLARVANISFAAEMAETETAMQDAEKLTTEVLRLYDSQTGGNLQSTKNLPFIQAWVATLASSERSGVTDKKGMLTRKGTQRLENAIIAKAFPERDLLDTLLESNDNNIRNIGNALIKLAPDTARLEAEIAEGDVFDQGIAREVSNAGAKLSELRSSKTPVTEYLDEQGRFTAELTALEEWLLRFFDANKRRPSRIVDLLTRYNEALRNAGTPKQGTLIEIPPPEKLELMQEAVDGLLDSETPPEDDPQGTLVPDPGLPEIAPLPAETTAPKKKPEQMRDAKGRKVKSSDDIAAEEKLAKEAEENLAKERADRKRRTDEERAPLLTSDDDEERAPLLTSDDISIPAIRPRQKVLKVQVAEGRQSSVTQEKMDSLLSAALTETDMPARAVKLRGGNWTIKPVQGWTGPFDLHSLRNRMLTLLGKQKGPKAVEGTGKPLDKAPPPQWEKPLRIKGTKKLMENLEQEEYGSWEDAGNPATLDDYYASDSWQGGHETVGGIVVPLIRESPANSLDIRGPNELDSLLMSLDYQGDVTGRLNEPGDAARRRSFRTWAKKIRALAEKHDRTLLGPGKKADTTAIRKEGEPMVPLNTAKAIATLATMNRNLWGKPDEKKTSLTIIGCCKAKGPKKVQAKDLYTSPLFKGSRQYAEGRRQTIVVASAEHGLVPSDHEIDPYNTTLTTRAAIDRYNARVKSGVSFMLEKYPNLETVEILAGAKYAKPLREALEKKGVTVTEPLKGKSVGQRLQWLNKETARPRPKKVEQAPDPFATRKADLKQIAKEIVHTFSVEKRNPTVERLLQDYPQITRKQAEGLVKGFNDFMAERRKGSAGGPVSAATEKAIRAQEQAAWDYYEEIGIAALTPANMAKRLGVSAKASRELTEYVRDRINRGDTPGKKTGKKLSRAQQAAADVTAYVQDKLKRGVGPAPLVRDLLGLPEPEKTEADRFDKPVSKEKIRQRQKELKESIKAFSERSEKQNQEAKERVEEIEAEPDSIPSIAPVSMEETRGDILNSITVETPIRWFTIDHVLKDVNLRQKRRKQPTATVAQVTDELIRMVDEIEGVNRQDMLDGTPAFQYLPPKRVDLKDPEKGFMRLPRRKGEDGDARPVPKNADVEFANEETEALFQKGLEGKQRHFWKDLLETADTWLKKFAREWKYLPRNVDRWVVARDLLKRMELGAPEATREIVDRVDRILKPLTNEEFLLFKRKLILDSARSVRDHNQKLMEEAPTAVEMQEPVGLPIELTEEALEDDRAQAVDRAFRENGELARALAGWRDLWGEVRMDLQDALRQMGDGARAKQLDTYGEYYIHHSILLESKRTLEDLEKTGRGKAYLRERKGSRTDLAVDLTITTQVRVLRDMRMDAEAARDLARLGEMFDKLRPLKREAARRIRQQIKAEFPDARERIHDELLAKYGRDTRLQGAKGAKRHGGVDESKIYRQRQAEWKKNRRNELKETINWQALAKERGLIGDQGTHTFWSPLRRRFNRVWTIPEADAIAAFEEGIVKVTSEAIRSRLALGFPQTWLIPNELAAQLSENDSRKREPGRFRKVVAATSLWKVWRLFNPGSIARYLFRNLAGDTSMALLWNPLGVRHYPRAIKELVNLKRPSQRGKPISKELQAFLRMGGASATVFGQEFNPKDLDLLRSIGATEFDRAMRALKRTAQDPTSASLKPLRAYMGGAKTVAFVLETVNRFGQFLSYLEQVKKNKGKPSYWVGYGGSYANEIAQFKTPEEKAYHLSNDLLGAYDQVSVHGQTMRSMAVPFWSFAEANFRTFYRILRNVAYAPEFTDAVKEGKMGKALAELAKVSPAKAMELARFGMIAFGLQVMANAWNHGVHGDEEDELPEDVQKSFHLVFGRNAAGEVIYFDRLGRFVEALNLTPMGHFPYRDYFDNRVTLEQALGVMTSDWVDNYANMLTPLVKTPFEVVRKERYFPSTVRARKRDDRFEAIADALGVKGVYDLARGYYLPGAKDQGRFDRWARNWGRSTWSYQIQGLQSAYYNNMANKRAFRKDRGMSSETYGERARPTIMLREMREALIYGDLDWAKAYWLEYAMAKRETESGRDLTDLEILQSAERSFTNFHPLHGVKTIEDEYRAWLTPEEQETLNDAFEYWEKLLGNLRQVVPDIRVKD